MTAHGAVARGYEVKLIAQRSVSSFFLAPQGNIYVNASGGQGGAGVMYEVDSLDNIVWGPYNAQSHKGFRYECDYPGIIALESYMYQVIPNQTITTSCFTSIPESWDCDGQGNCYDPGTGNGIYTTQAACIAVCGVNSIEEHTTNKQLLKITDILGREVNEKRNTTLFYIYNDGTVEKKMIIE